MSEILFAKDYVEPELTTTQRKQLDLFIEEHNESSAEYEPERIDKVTVTGDDLIIHTSRFIELVFSGSSSNPSRHLQIMTVYRAWNNTDGDGGNTPDDDWFDPYCDIEERGYREVYLTSVNRTAKGDEGWITGHTTDDEGHYLPVYTQDNGPLHTDWVK